MQPALTLYQTTIGKKAVMAASGIVLFGFVVVHMLGNLQLYLGPEVINEYAASLRRVPALLWGARVALLLAVLAHIASAFRLWQTNTDARPVQYRKQRPQATTYAARTMYWSGPILLFYIVYHLAHLTFGKTGGTYAFDPHNVYNNLVYGFQSPLISAIYIVGNLALGFHLFHGVWALFQSLGASHPRWNDLKRKAAIGLALFVTVGNLSFPIAVLSGVVEPTDQTFHFVELE